MLVYQKNQTICKLKSNHVFFYNNLKKKYAKQGNSTGLLSHEMRLVSKKSGEYKPVTVYAASITGKKIAPDVGWSHSLTSGSNDI